MTSSTPQPRQLRDRLLPPAGPHFILDERLPVSVEFAPVEGQPPLAEGEQVRRSAQAMNSALNSMRSMAKLVSEAMGSLEAEPAQMDVRFGIRLDASGKAFVVEKEETASLSVTLTWKSPSRPGGVSLQSEPAAASFQPEADPYAASEQWQPPVDDPARYPAWEQEPVRAEAQPTWETDRYGTEAWDEEEDLDWENDDRPAYRDPYRDRPAYEDTYAPPYREGYREDYGDRYREDYREGYRNGESYPDPESEGGVWPRRSRRSPRNRNPLNPPSEGGDRPRWWR